MAKALFARLALFLAASTLVCAALMGCTRRDSAEAGDLRERLARLEEQERQAADDRAKLTEEMAAMREDVNSLRASLDAANQRLDAGASAPGAAAQPAPARPAKTPHASLKRSLHEMYESSRSAIGRLEQKLDSSLHRARSKNGTEEQTN